MFKIPDRNPRLGRVIHGTGDIN